VKQTTQFVVGASDETDREIVKYSWGLYDRLDLTRIYFSAYQRGLGEPDLPGERSAVAGGDLLTREHRLYQVDFLFRRYRFQEDDIAFGPGGNLSLKDDPKEIWARRHPEFFPLDVNRAGYYDLLRVPGLGPTTVKAILDRRKAGTTIRRIEDLGRPGKLLRKAEGFLKFGYGRGSLFDWMS
jgi:predicted DNA-binding helix-hairpin-helix protein